MSAQIQTLLGLAMMVLGAVKTWLHIGTVPVLSLPSCSGKSIDITLGGGSFFAQAHCWGCYMFAAGLAITVFAIYRLWQKRRSVAIWTD